jgi:hypothetical protein
VSWRFLFYKRELIGDKNLGFDGSRRVLSALSSSIGLPTRIDDAIPLNPYLSMALLLPIKLSLGTMLCNSMSLCSLNVANWRPRLDNLAFDFWEVGEADRLEVPLEEREVLEVVKGMDRDNAPSPDGFSMAFFQDCWEVIKENIMAVFFQTFMLVVSLKKALMLLLFLLFRRCLGLPSIRSFVLLVL